MLVYVLIAFSLILAVANIESYLHDGMEPDKPEPGGMTRVVMILAMVAVAYLFAAAFLGG